MIYGKMWLVVKPSVGVPVFLGAVAVGSFAVHVALLTNTTWVPKYLNGGTGAAKVSAVEAPADMAAAAPTVLTATAAPAGLRQ
jgi:light-harvesting protein B-800-850 alpha chain